ncbi:DUF4169 family protein [Pseudogemmobacter faecipullorum]|uniref:DUF4169 family protein n=1 Tax=Pseudogemmobacter faecipullorum TaxID=2755041 RepID=A0ABS8CL08_9RHOB|nr:DUF4169 family protein [Pseudogemmobacter faecipullorum]MCB5410061.1 DUF4169 family protein [Pseudogemmobacter faecipullorum]
MAEIVSLNRFRKEKDRVAKRARADANAVKFGRTKAEKDLEKARAEQSARALDSAKRDQSSGEAAPGPAPQPDQD